MQISVLHHVSKNIPLLTCYNFDIRERILIFLGRNVADKVSNPKMLYYATSNNLCFCTTWQNGETWKLHFFYSNAELVHQLLFDFFNLSDSRLMLTLLYDSPNLVINAFSSGLLRERFRRKEVNHCSSWTLLHAQCIDDAQCIQNSPISWLHTSITHIHMSSEFPLAR